MVIPVLSSEIYRVSPSDLMALNDGEISGEADYTDEVVVLLGHNGSIGSTDNRDVLIKGRAVIRKALDDRLPFIPVRFAFIPANKPFDLLSPVIRAMRYRIRYYGSNVYHLNPKDIRAMKIERSVKTPETAYSFTHSGRIMSKQERKDEYKRIYDSIRDNGFSDAEPIDIMLCRLCGAKDCLNNGHHRMSIALELGLDKVPVRFSAAGAAPAFLRPVLKKFSTFELALKRRFRH